MATMNLSGRVWELAMPDIPAVLMACGRVPSPVIAHALVLLDAEGSIPKSTDDPTYFQRRIEQITGMYAVFELCAVEPKFKAFTKPAPGELGPTDISWADLEVVYYAFFRNWSHVADQRVDTTPDDTSRSA